MHSYLLHVDRLHYILPIGNVVSHAALPFRLLHFDVWPWLVRLLVRPSCVAALHVPACQDVRPVFMQNMPLTSWAMPAPAHNFAPSCTAAAHTAFLLLLPRFPNLLLAL